MKRLDRSEETVHRVANGSFSTTGSAFPNRTPHSRKERDKGVGIFSVYALEQRCELSLVVIFSPFSSLLIVRRMGFIGARLYRFAARANRSAARDSPQG